MIYLDYHTITPPLPSVVKEMGKFFSEKWGTPSAQHQKGLELYAYIDQALEKIYRCLKVPQSFFFSTTPGKIEAHTQFLFSFYQKERLAFSTPHFLTSSIEESPVVLSMQRFASLGCVETYLPVNKNGQIDVEELKKISPKTSSLLTFSLANSLTGVLQPIESITEICRSEAIALHLNLSHTMGIIDINWEEVDSVYFDGDKIGTPQGIGGLFQKTTPLEITSHVAALCGLSVAIEKTFEHQNSKRIEIARLRDAFEQELKYAIPDCEVLFQEIERLPGICVVSFPSIFSETLLYFLGRRGLCATIGGGQYQTLSMQLKKCGFSDKVCYGALSFAISSETSEEQLANALDIIVTSVRKLKTFSVAL